MNISYAGSQSVMVKHLVPKDIAVGNPPGAESFKENVRYLAWICRDPISLILGT